MDPVCTVRAVFSRKAFLAFRERVVKVTYTPSLFFWGGDF